MQSLRLVAVQQKRGVGEGNVGLLKNHVEDASSAIRELLRVKPMGYVAYLDKLLEIVGREVPPPTTTEVPRKEQPSDAAVGATANDYILLNKRLLSAPSVLQAIVEIRRFHAATSTGSSITARVPVSISLLFHLYSLYQVSKRRLVVRQRSQVANPFRDRYADPPPYTAAVQIFLTLLDSVVVPHPLTSGGYSLRDALDLKLIVRDTVADSVRCSEAGRQLLQVHAAHKECVEHKCSSLLEFRKLIRTGIRRQIMNILPRNSVDGADFENSAFHKEVVSLVERSSKAGAPIRTVQQRAAELLADLNAQTQRRVKGGQMGNELLASDWQDALHLVKLAGAANAARMPGTIHSETRSALRTATSLRVSPMSCRQAEELLRASANWIHAGKELRTRVKQAHNGDKAVTSVGEVLQHISLAQKETPNWALSIALLCQVDLYDIATPLVPYYFHTLSEIPSRSPLDTLLPRGLVAYLDTLSQFRGAVDGRGVLRENKEATLLSEASSLLCSPTTKAQSIWCPVALAELVVMWWDQRTSEEDWDPPLHVCNALRGLLTHLVTGAAAASIVSSSLQDQTLVKQERSGRHVEVAHNLHTIGAQLSIAIRRSLSLLAVWALHNWDEVADVAGIDGSVGRNEFGLRWMVSPMPYQQISHTEDSFQEGLHHEHNKYFLRYAPPGLFDGTSSHSSERQRENHQSVVTAGAPSVLADGRALTGLLNCRHHLPVFLRRLVHETTLGTLEVPPEVASSRLFQESLLRSLAAYSDEIVSMDAARAKVLAELELEASGVAIADQNSRQTSKAPIPTEWKLLLEGSPDEIDADDLSFLFNVMEGCAQWLAKGESFCCCACRRHSNGEALCKHAVETLASIWRHRIESSSSSPMD